MLPDYVDTAQAGSGPTDDVMGRQNSRPESSHGGRQAGSLGDTCDAPSDKCDAPGHPADQAMSKRYQGQCPSWTCELPIDILCDDMFKQNTVK